MNKYAWRPFTASDSIQLTMLNGEKTVLGSVSFAVSKLTELFSELHSSKIIEAFGCARWLVLTPSEYIISIDNFANSE